MAGELVRQRSRKTSNCLQIGISRRLFVQHAGTSRVHLFYSRRTATPCGAFLHSSRNCVHLDCGRTPSRPRARFPARTRCRGSRTRSPSSGCGASGDPRPLPRVLPEHRRLACHGSDSSDCGRYPLVVSLSRQARRHSWQVIVGVSASRTRSGPCRGRDSCSGRRTCCSA
jgi:hypothetical protein